MTTALEYRLEVVVVPVSDVDRAIAFYVDQVGFNLDVDHKNGEFRVVQMTPNGSACSVTIGVGLADMPPGAVKGLQLVVKDIDAAQADLTSRGVDVTPVRHHDGTGWADGPGGDWNSFVFFNDPDGNAWTVQQSPGWKETNPAGDADGA
jgi:catechol 2,3-dioxygenase-like lactoylglutathione lyase family enzyme